MALVNKNKNFIFFHLYKCAGTSLRRVFDPTPHLHETIEAGNFHSLPRDIKKIYHDAGAGDWFDGTIKFTFIRNPFDWLVSIYCYILENKSHELHGVIKDFSFNSFLIYYTSVMMKNEGVPLGNNKSVTLFDYVSDSDGIIVDYICRYENLEEDVRMMCRKVGLPYTSIPRDNVTSNRKDYRSYYDDFSKSLVEKYFSEDLRVFNYKF